MLYVCVCVYMYVYMYIYIPTHTYMHVYTYIHSNVSASAACTLAFNRHPVCTDEFIWDFNFIIRKETSVSSSQRLAPVPHLTIHACPSPVSTISLSSLHIFLCPNFQPARWHSLLQYLVTPHPAHVINFEPVSTLELQLSQQDPPDE